MEAWTLSSALAAVWPATSAVPFRVFAAIAAFVAGVAARPAAFSRHQLSAAPVAGALAPVSAGAFVVPGPASRVAFLAVAGIPGPAAGSQCLEEPGVLQAEGRADERQCWGGEARCSLDAQRACFPLAELRHDWRQGDKALLPVWPVRRRGR